MTTTEILKHFFNCTSVLDKEVQTRIMNAIFDYVSTGQQFEPPVSESSVLEKVTFECAKMMFEYFEEQTAEVVE